MTDSKLNSGSKSGFNRRDFLRVRHRRGGHGLASAGQAADEKSGPEVVRGEKTITLNVNGKDQKVEVEPRMTLLEVLRYRST